MFVISKIVAPCVRLHMIIGSVNSLPRYLGIQIHGGICIINKHIYIFLIAH